MQGTSAGGSRKRHRVLVLHSTYTSGWVSGENSVVQAEVDLLRSDGYEVDLYAPTPDVTGTSGRARLAASAVVGGDSLRQVRSLISDRRPDLVHLHNLFPMFSPNVIRAVSELGIPSVMTLHNYRLMCLPATFLRDGKVCTLCQGKNPWRGVVYKCYRGSASASAVLGSSLTVHRAIGTWDKVTRFAAISDFLKNEYVTGGLDAERISVKRHFTWPTERRTGPGETFLFLGRLSEEKGIDWLIRSWLPELGRLVIAGSGPDEERLSRSPSPGVSFVGPKPPEQVPDLIRAARAVIVPSICNEPAGRVVLEAYAAGVPVIAARIGGLPEVVADESTGFLVDPNDDEGLREAVRRLHDDRLSEEMGNAAYSLWQESYSPARQVELIGRLYDEVIAAGPGTQHG